MNRHAAALGRKGGKAGTGAAKRRSREHYQAAIAKRWAARCKGCGTPERIADLGGVQYSNLSPFGRLCERCIKSIMDGAQKWPKLI